MGSASSLCDMKSALGNACNTVLAPGLFAKLCVLRLCSPNMILSVHFRQEKWEVRFLLSVLYCITSNKINSIPGKKVAEFVLWTGELAGQYAQECSRTWSNVLHYFDSCPLGFYLLMPLFLLPEKKVLRSWFLKKVYCIFQNLLESLHAFSCGDAENKCKCRTDTET